MQVGLSCISSVTCLLIGPFATNRTNVEKNKTFYVQYTFFFVCHAVYEIIKEKIVFMMPTVSNGEIEPEWLHYAYTYISHLAVFLSFHVYVLSLLMPTD